jgi:hypothetical protein
MEIGEVRNGLFIRRGSSAGAVYKSKGRGDGRGGAVAGTRRLGGALTTSRGVHSTRYVIC